MLKKNTPFVETNQNKTNQKIIVYSFDNYWWKSVLAAIAGSSPQTCYISKNMQTLVKLLLASDLNCK